MKEKTIKLRKTELDILAYLLDHHIAEGSYFGNKNQHYKMVKELLKKIDLTIAFPQKELKIIKS
jgi:hypothetical protein